MNQLEVFVNDLTELPDGRDLELTVRTLDPGIHKYTYKRVKCNVSSELEQFEDRLQVRFGRGQLSDKQFAIRVLEEIPRIPKKYL